MGGVKDIPGVMPCENMPEMLRGLEGRKPELQPLPMPRGIQHSGNTGAFRGQLPRRPEGRPHAEGWHLHGGKRAGQIL
jgi:hypothetical protein